MTSCTEGGEWVKHFVTKCERLEARELGLPLRPFIRQSDGLIWATPGLDSLSEDYVMLNQSRNNTVKKSFF